MTSVLAKRALRPDDVLFICDFTPPRSADPDRLEPARHLDADFISVAYNPGKSVRVTSVAAAAWIMQRAGKEVVFTLATRDMNKLAVQSLLLGAALWGLENVVIVQGDAFTEKELTAVSAVDDFRPTELIRSVLALNDGRDYKGGKLPDPTNLCVGATIDLGDDRERQAQLSHRKVQAGAQFFLLQALFDPLHLEQFLDLYARVAGEPLAVPLFAGIQILTPDSLVFGPVPAWITDDLATGRPGEEIAVALVHQFIDSGFKSIYLIPPILRGGRRDYPAAQRVLAAFRG